MLKFKTPLIVFFFFTSMTKAQHGGPTPVKIASVEMKMMAPIRKIPATIKAKVLATIKAESKGVVTTIVDIGTFVEKGKPLAELTDTQSSLRKQELKDAVNSSKARFDFFKAEKHRLKDLVKKNLISKSELEQNNSDFLSAKSELAQSQSRLYQYLDQITKLTISAPFDGYLMQQFTQIGAWLNSGDNAVELMQANNLEVVVFVPIKYKSQIRNKSVWKIQTQQGVLIDATVNTFTPAAVGKSHTIEVHLVIQDSNLWPGESVNVLMPTKTPQKAMAVPRDALVIRQSGVYLYTIKDNKANKVDVTTGIAQGNFIQVFGDLTTDDSVIIRGNERIRPQSDLKIIK